MIGTGSGVGRFTDELRRDAEPIWAAQHAHPFIRGIADGTLEAERFRHFIRQDYLFLVDYTRALALACVRAPSLELMRRFAGLAQETLAVEMELHLAFAAEWGIAPEELETEAIAPTTRAYTDFLLRTAALGDYSELLAALLPCAWGYSRLGLELAAEEHAERYARWIDLYASPEFAELAEWLRGVTDELAAGICQAGRARMREAFVQSSRYELAFWEAAWRLERA